MTTDATLDYNSPYIANLRSTAWWLYIFHAVCFLFTLGIFSFVPLILNYLVRPRAIHTWLYTHQTWQIRSVLVVLRLGCSGLGLLFHHHRHDICRRSMGSGMVLVHLSPDKGFPLPERRHPDALSGRMIPISNSLIT